MGKKVKKLKAEIKRQKSQNDMRQKLAAQAREKRETELRLEILRYMKLAEKGKKKLKKAKKSLHLACGYS